MIPQNISDALARIKAALSGSSDQTAADAKTINDLQGQVSALTAAGAAKDAKITDLSSQLDDATSQLSDIESQLLQLSPPPAS